MIKHLIMDVDGVLNTGQTLYSKEGKMFKVFGPHDRDGIKIAQDLGLTIDFISADVSGFEITCARLVKDWGFSQENVHLVDQDSRLYWIENNFDLDRVAFIGDGYFDVPTLKAVHLGITPNNARREARKVADYVTESNAGEGAVLDACLYIKEYMHG